MLKKNQFPEFSHQGILKCARYAFMPNKLQFCGPNKNQDLFYYAHSQEPDYGLNLILKEFQTLYPYLKLIAKSNQMQDVFNEKIVEAYWIGNSLLENTSKSELYSHFKDGLNLKKKLNLKDFRKITDKISLKPKPYHSFHVLNIWKNKEDLDSLEILNAMDLCRISWGKIKKIHQAELEVECQPLIVKDNKLALGSFIPHKIFYKIDDAGFIKNPKIGDWVSFHWNFVCEILNQSQIRNLEKYTQESIDLVN